MQKRDKKGRFLPVHSGFAGVKPLRIRRIVESYRAGFIEDHGGPDKIPTARLILIDRTCSLLGVILCMESHVRENYIFKGKEILPVLSNHYLAYVNSLQRHLALIGLDLKDLPAVELAEVIKEIKDKKEKGK